jgi:hypothetical protein
MERHLSRDQQSELLAVQGVQHLAHDPKTWKKMVSGVASLKESQVHPRDYGRACSESWVDSNEKKPDDVPSDSEEDIDWVAWKMANRHCQLRELDVDDCSQFVPVDRVWRMLRFVDGLYRLAILYIAWSRHGPLWRWCTALVATRSGMGIMCRCGMCNLQRHARSQESLGCRQRATNGQYFRLLDCNIQ